MKDQRSFSRMLGVATALAVVLALAQLGVSEYGHRRASGARDRAAQAFGGLRALEQFERQINGAVSARHEYMESGSPEQLAAFRSAREAAAADAASMAAAATGDEELRSALARLRDDASALLATLERDVENRRDPPPRRMAGRHDAEPGIAAEPRIDDALARVSALLAARSTEAIAGGRQTREFERLLVIALTGSVVLVFLLVFRSVSSQARRIVDEKARADDELERLEAMVHARTTELSELTAYLHKVREDERRVLARELHDELGSILTAARLDVGYIKNRTAQSNPELQAKCDRLAGMIDQGMALKRRIIDNLRPSTLDMLGLASATRELADSFAAGSHIAVRSEIDGEIDLRNDDALALYRLIQEALANVAKHAGASEVELRLELAGDLLHARVHDNGKGFDQRAESLAGRMGLGALRQRIRALGGRVAVNSGPGEGTTIEVWMPHRPG